MLKMHRLLEALFGWTGLVAPAAKRRLDDDAGPSNPKIRRLNDSQVREPADCDWIGGHINSDAHISSSSNSVVRISRWEHDGKENLDRPNKVNHNMFPRHSGLNRNRNQSTSGYNEILYVGQTMSGNTEDRRHMASSLKEPSRVQYHRSRDSATPECLLSLSDESVNRDIHIVREIPSASNYNNGKCDGKISGKNVSPFCDGTHNDVPYRNAYQEIVSQSQGTEATRPCPIDRRKFLFGDQPHNLQPEIQILHPSNRLLNGMDTLQYKSQMSVLSADSMSSRCRSTLEHEKRAENESMFNEIMRRAVTFNNPRVTSHNDLSNGSRTSDDEVQFVEDNNETSLFRQKKLGQHFHVPATSKCEKLNVSVDRQHELKPSTSAARRQCEEEVKIIEDKSSKWSSRRETRPDFMQNLDTLLQNLERSEKLRKVRRAERSRETEQYAELSRRAELVRQKRYEKEIAERLETYMKITEEGLEADDIEEVPVLPKLTPEIEDEIDKALLSPDGRNLVDAFNITIKGRDIHTLKPLAWLNDEVINFYMNLFIERGKNDNYPSLYAFNTFFYPKLVNSGYATLKRWTKKVDIFAHDLLLVPVHLGLHWCMAIIDMKEKALRYYDSLGGKNQQCLDALLDYLVSEHVDKKKSKFNTTGWIKECPANIPHQRNGSDCGVFSCMYAEYVSRKAPITFSQEDMPYFRRKMVYEILNRKLLS